MSRKLHQWLERAVCDYEQAALLDAVNYRSLGKSASLEEKLAAAKRDLRWWELHAQEVPRQLDRIAGEISLIIES
jgi:hypothetical protein